MSESSTATNTPKKTGTKSRTGTPRSGGRAKSDLDYTASASRETSPLAKLREENWLITESPHQGRTSVAFLLSRNTEDFDEDEELFAKVMSFGFVFAPVLPISRALMIARANHES